MISLRFAGFVKNGKGFTNAVAYDIITGVVTAWDRS